MLDREAVLASSGGEVALEWLVRNEATTDRNGTTVDISDVVLKKLNQTAVIQYIEKHLQTFRSINPEVAVGNHLCAFRELYTSETRSFKPSPKQRSVIGDVELIVRISTSPLIESDRGVLITAGPGAKVAQEDGSVCSKEMGPYLFGEVDVQALERSDSPLEPYDSTRRLKLNPQHPTAAALIPFIAKSLDEVRRELVQRHRTEQKSQESKRLAQEAERIAEILNGDFQALSSRLREIRSASSSSGRAAAKFGGTAAGDQDADDWVDGSTQPGTTEKPTGSQSSGGAQGRAKPDITKKGRPDEAGDNSVDPVGDGSGTRKRPSAGFRVDYRHLGQQESDRSRYDSTSLTILINLDHASVQAALKNSSVEGVSFRRLSYEIAFTEYAFALENHFLDEDPDKPAIDAVYDVRDTLNRVAAAAAHLYAES